MDGWPYRYEIIDVGMLTVDGSYQRPLTSLVNRIESGFDPALVGTLVVSRRSTGVLAVVDGQTRAAAIGRLAAAGRLAVSGVPCLVYEGLSRADEASLFARLQKERRGIASYHRFRAAVVAGEEEAVAIQALAEAAGHEVGEAPKLSAVAALERVYRRSPEILARTFAVLTAAWSADYVPNGDMLRGVGRLLHTVPAIRDRQLAQRLRDLTPGYVKRLALEASEGSRGGGGFEAHVADALEAIYHGYAGQVGTVRDCEAPKCAATAMPGGKYCAPHAAMATELHRRHLTAVA